MPKIIHAKRVHRSNGGLLCFCGLFCFIDDKFSILLYSLFCVIIEISLNIYDRGALVSASGGEVTE